MRIPNPYVGPGALRLLLKRGFRTEPVSYDLAGKFNVGGGVYQTPSYYPDQTQPTRHSFVVAVAAPAGTTYNDSASGSLRLSGSAVEDFHAVPIKLVARAFTSPELPNRTRLIPPTTRLYNDAASGSLRLSGSAVESFSIARLPILRTTWDKTPDAVRSSRLVPVAAAAIVYNDSASGSLRLSGSAVETFTAVPPQVLRQPRQSYRDPLALPVSTPIGGTFLQATVTYNDSSSGQLVLSGSAVETFTTITPITVLVGSLWENDAQVGVARSIRILKAGSFFDSASGSLRLSGSSTESFTGGAAPQADPNYFLLIHS